MSALSYLAGAALLLVLWVSRHWLLAHGSPAMLAAAAVALLAAGLAASLRSTHLKRLD